MIVRIIVFMFLASISLSGFLEAANIDGRNDLLQKYKEEKEICFLLKNILKTNIYSKKDINIFYNSLDELSGLKSIKSSELLVDLLDFYLGETPMEIITKAIIEKGDSSLPFLRRKMLAEAIHDEMPNEQNINLIRQKRNERIVFIIEHICYKIPYGYEYSELDPISLTKVKLYNIQKHLKNFFNTKGKYPVDLMELKTENNNFESNLVIDGWSHSFIYKSGSVFYFLGSKGKDGLCGTQDDIFPPIFTELHKPPLEICSPN